MMGITNASYKIAQFYFLVFPVGAETPSTSADQEEEACDGGASAGAGPQAPSEWSCSTGKLPDHPAEGVYHIQQCWDKSVYTGGG